MMLGSFSMMSVRAHEHVIAEHRNTLMTSMMRNMSPNAMHRYSNHGGLMPPSAGSSHRVRLRAVSPGSSTNTVVLAVNVPFSVCESATANASLACCCCIAVDGEPSQYGSAHAPRHTSMSHWKYSSGLSGNRNMDVSIASACPDLGSYLNGVITFALDGQLRKRKLSDKKIVSTSENVSGRLFLKFARL